MQPAASAQLFGADPPKIFAPTSDSVAAMELPTVDVNFLQIFQPKQGDQLHNYTNYTDYTRRSLRAETCSPLRCATPGPGVSLKALRRSGLSRWILPPQLWPGRPTGKAPGHAAGQGRCQWLGSERICRSLRKLSQCHPPGRRKLRGEAGGEAGGLEWIYGGHAELRKCFSMRKT